jgi:hypothetical protein
MDHAVANAHKQPWPNAIRRRLLRFFARQRRPNLLSVTVEQIPRHDLSIPARRRQRARAPPAGGRTPGYITAVQTSDVEIQRWQ